MSPDLPLNLADFEAAARERLSPQAWAYFSGAAADEHTLAANRSDWAAHRLLPRVLRPLSGSSTAINMGGLTLAHPIFLAPVACQRMAHPEGERATAMAAAAQGAGMILSSQSSVAVEAVAAAMAEPGAGPLWFQLYWQAQREATLALVRRAEAAGCQTLVLTVDAPVHGVRDRERRAGFEIPPGISAVHLAGLPPPPDSLTALLAAAPSWDDVAWLRQQTRLPLWLKGVLHADDARQAADSGCVDGLIISNHGGRTLDSTVSTAWALPRVAEALNGRLPLIVDGGIRRGTDVLKALALGAHAVAVGRPQVFALADDGAMGVARMLRLLRDEFAIALALCGCRSPDDVSRALLA
ncbi:alpha-hydroxy acid oxidase [Ideonella sp.]|uniref:alpha-hydroxy acid oxidase n=1 Tax=Ideonella sp. TaxID=1929293 RepID=UPI003BB4D321